MIDLIDLNATDSNSNYPKLNDMDTVNFNGYANEIGIDNKNTSQNKNNNKQNEDFFDFFK